jgi:hypothetical protein
MLHAYALSHLKHFSQLQHHFMAISTLDARLPALEDLITLIHAIPLPKRSARDSLAISDTIPYSYANSMITRTRVEYTYISLSERDACKM